MHLGRTFAWTVAWMQIAGWAAAAEAPVVISDFKNPAGMENWRAEGGKLTLGAGHRGQGAVLAYRLVCDRTDCGETAEAMWTAPPQFPKVHNPAVSLWIRIPVEVEAWLLVEDQSGQTVRFPIAAASIECPKAGDWQYVIIPLSGPEGKLKGRLTGAGIEIRSRARATVQGELAFDEVRLHEASESFLIDSAAASSADPQSVLAPQIGVNIHLLQDAGTLDLARAAGFRFVRMDMLWANVERNGRYRFFAYDNLLRALETRGMGVLWILDYGHPDHGGAVPRTPPDIAAFARFAEAAAAHFKGRNVRFEIWNEPNTSHFWAPSPNAAEYAGLLRESVAAIRRADPTARISSGGLSRIDLAFLSRALNPAVAGELVAIGIHPYPTAGPEAIAAELAILREWAARALGERVAVWDTEWGYSSCNAPKEAPSNGHTEAGRNRQAALAVRELLSVWAERLPLAVWYDLRDDGHDATNPEHNYGLLDADGNEKPALAAVRTLMNAAADRRFTGMLPEVPVGMHAARLDGPKDTAFIIWNAGPAKRDVVFSRQRLISGADYLGRPLKLKNGPAGSARLEMDEAAGPVYLVFGNEGGAPIGVGSR